MTTTWTVRCGMFDADLYRERADGSLHYIRSLRAPVEAHGSAHVAFLKELSIELVLGLLEGRCGRIVLVGPSGVVDRLRPEPAGVHADVIAERWIAELPVGDIPALAAELRRARQAEARQAAAPPAARAERAPEAHAGRDAWALLAEAQAAAPAR